MNQIGLDIFGDRRGMRYATAASGPVVSIGSRFGTERHNQALRAAPGRRGSARRSSGEWVRYPKSAASGGYRFLRRDVQPHEPSMVRSIGARGSPAPNRLPPSRSRRASRAFDPCRMAPGGALRDRAGSSTGASGHCALAAAQSHLQNPGRRKNRYAFDRMVADPR